MAVPDSCRPDLVRADCLPYVCLADVVGNARLPFPTIEIAGREGVIMLLKNWFAGLSELRRQRRLKRPRNVGEWRLTNLAAECVESRALLSNIAVTLQAGVITLTGDTGDHTIAASVVNGQLELVGSNGTDFTFNGNTATTIDVPLTSPLKALYVNLQQAGNNTLTFDGTNLPAISGNVVMQLGDGTDTIVFENATVKGVVDVHAGNGGDTIQVLNDTVGGLAIFTGSGNDSILVSSVTVQGPGQGQSGNGGSNADLVDGNAGTTGRPLVISTGLGDDTVEVDSVVSAGKALGGKWQIDVGSGNDTVTMNSDADHGFLTVTATGAGNDVVTINNSTFGKQVTVSLPNGLEQIVLSGDTFTGKVNLATGTGSGSSISVDDSLFRTVAMFTMAGDNALVNLETANVAGPGSEFQGPFFVAMSGASAIVNLGTNTVGNALTFDKVVHITGGIPAATVTVVDANVKFKQKLLLMNATRVDV
jgi:hypothetical protein